MNVIGILVAVVVVTILVTIVLGIGTYVAYKLRLARRPDPQQAPDGPRYFVIHEPPSPVPTDASQG